MNSSVAIGIDVGGTKIAAGLVRFPGGHVTGWQTVPTLAERGGEAVLGSIEELVLQLASEERVSGIGIGICELVNAEGTIQTQGCIHLTTAQIVERLGLIAPVRVEADVRSAALAEARFGGGRNARTFLYVTIGTGISSCLVIDGKPYMGSRGATGTLGSGPFPVNGKPLEQFASGPGLAVEFGMSAREVLSAAASGNTRAIEMVREAAKGVGAAIGWLVNVLDPELVLLGGGLGLASGLYREQMVAAAREHIWWPGHRDLPIISAETGARAGVIGAAIIAAQRAGIEPS